MAVLPPIPDMLGRMRPEDPEAGLRGLAEAAGLDAAARARIADRAAGLVGRIRAGGRPGLAEAFLAEYGLSTDEGVALMCLAEAMLRVPDAPTLDALIEDKIAPSDWGRHLGRSASPMVNASSWALMLTGRVLSEGAGAGVAGALRGALRRLGEPVIRAAVARAMRELGTQFVLGEDIDAAMARAATLEAAGWSYSYDMLGEAARTAADADAYMAAYEGAIAALAGRTGTARDRAGGADGGGADGGGADGGGVEGGGVEGRPGPVGADPAAGRTGPIPATTGRDAAGGPAGRGGGTGASGPAGRAGGSDAAGPGQTLAQAAEGGAGGTGGRVGRNADRTGGAARIGDIRDRPGISVKLSALHPRYEEAQRDRALAELTPRLARLARAAREAGIGLNVDAEEADRLALSAEVIRRVLADPGLAGWDGFGVVVQAYGPRAGAVIDWLEATARAQGRRLMVRLVKGAYWDSEIKRAQVLGVDGFSVFTAKAETDVAYIAHARRLLAARDRLYPQFATHNAHTVCAVLEIAEALGAGPDSFEFQRLHGMGERLHALVRAEAGTRCRIYAPVGAHRDLLAYLVRRLLENGANSSFVHQIVDESVPAEAVAACPFAALDRPRRALPTGPALFRPGRENARGLDLACAVDRAAFEAARAPFRDATFAAGPILADAAAPGPAGPDPRSPEATGPAPAVPDPTAPPHEDATGRSAVDKAAAAHGGTDAGAPSPGVVASGPAGRRPMAADAAADDAAAPPAPDRGAGADPAPGPGGPRQPVANPAEPRDVVGLVCPASPADVDRALAAARPWAAPGDARAAVLARAAGLYEAEAGRLFALLAREAGKTPVDALADLREAVDFLRYYGAQAATLTAPARGTFACISPWNFPLAIFTGQVAAALAAGNAVLAKPAEQTPLVAAAAVALLHRAGVPRSALQLLPGGSAVGAALTRDRRVDGVAFTGSTDTARTIRRAMAEHLAPGAPLIAETGGLNAMVVDSTALPEQAVRDVIASAFQSAGQRCSALRCLYVQHEIAAEFRAMLFGAMDELALGDPWRIATDIGPIIDAPAARTLRTHIEAARAEGRVLKELPAPAAGHFVGPTVIAVPGIAALEREVFGPVLHLATFRARDLDRVIDAVNATGYGLTFGLHSRIDDRVRQVSERLRVGNLYVNRNQIGAVVGSQPFGGEGLSGTGPKAGGPHYLARFTARPAPGVAPPAPATAPEATAPEAAAGGLPRPTPLDPAPAQAPSPAPGLTVTAPTPPAAPVPAWLLTALAEAAPAQGPLSVTDMPGPTGESNRLALWPRAPLLCLGPGAEAAEAQAAAVRTLGGVAIPVPDPLPAAALQTLPGLAGVLWWGDEATGRALACALAARDGPILPLITGMPDAAHATLERHLCIDTTAAGGNAALLAEVDG